MKVERKVLILDLPKDNGKACSAVVYLGDNVVAQWVILKVVWRENSLDCNWLRTAVEMVERWDLLLVVCKVQQMEFGKDHLSVLLKVVLKASKEVDETEIMLAILMVVR